MKISEKGKVKKGVATKMEKEEKKETEKEERTIEELLKQLREEKGWTYIHVVEELNKIKYITNDKQVKKWEIGIEYPSLEAIYKLSELYLIPSETFIMAKNNSFQKGLETIHMRAIKWICYFTGVSLKMAYVGVNIFIGLALIGALMFFVSKVDEFLAIRRNL